MKFSIRLSNDVTIDMIVPVTNEQHPAWQMLKEKYLKEED